MLLRPYQRDFVGKCKDALLRHGNTLGIAPTGAGKTVILSAITGDLIRSGKVQKAMVLQHRDELLAQNAAKFRKVNPDIRFSIFNADRKDWSGDVVFVSEPTLRREANLAKMPKVDLAVIDEAHHVAAQGYKKILTHTTALQPNALRLGVTATPNRGDKVALEPIFDNVAAQIHIYDLIKSGHLVRPRTFVIDVGVNDQLARVRKTVSDFDMDEVAAIMDRPVINEAVVRHWKEKAADRRTIVFCSTINHAEHVAKAFADAGVRTEVVHSGLGDERRRSLIRRYAAGEVQVLVNVAILTEGFDDQTTSCVVLLRPCSYQGTMVQMIGRGLRVVDPALHPGVVKTDCVVLDFGRSILTHGTVEQNPNLKPMKHCGLCAQMVEYGFKCGDCPPPEERLESEAGLDEEESEPLADFVMTEIDLFAKSNFSWVDLFGDDMALMASGFNAWAGVYCNPQNGVWYAVGCEAKKQPKLLGMGDRIVAIALGDDFLNEHETGDSAYKTKKWLKDPASYRQMEFLPEFQGQTISKYQASCLMNHRFAKAKIRGLILGI